MSPLVIEFPLTLPIMGGICFAVDEGFAMNALSRGSLMALDQTDYRSVSMFDTHLGTRRCRSDFLADSCLVGDTID